MRKKLTTHAAGKSDRCASREILRRYRKRKTDRTEQCHKAALPQDIPAVARADAVVDDILDNKRDHQLKQRLEQFEQRRQHAIALVSTHVDPEFFHMSTFLRTRVFLTGSGTANTSGYSISRHYG